MNHTCSHKPAIRPIATGNDLLDLSGRSSTADSGFIRLGGAFRMPVLRASQAMRRRVG